MLQFQTYRARREVLFSLFPAIRLCVCSVLNLPSKGNHSLIFMNKALLYCFGTLSAFLVHLYQALAFKVGLSFHIAKEDWKNYSLPAQTLPDPVRLVGTACSKAETWVSLGPERYVKSPLGSSFPMVLAAVFARLYYRDACWWGFRSESWTFGFLERHCCF